MSFDVPALAPGTELVSINGRGAVPVMLIEEQKGAREALQHSREARMLADGVAYLRPGPFYAAAEGETLETFEASVDEAFHGFVASGAQDLVIDLRNNPGGISAQMLGAMKQYEDGDTFTFEIPQVQPRDATFPGRTWVLVNRHSYSNATSAADVILRDTLRRVLAERP